MTLKHFTSTQFPRSFPSRRWILSPHSCSEPATKYSKKKKKNRATFVKTSIVSILACRQSACKNEPTLLLARDKHAPSSFFQLPKWTQTTHLRHQIPIAESPSCTQFIPFDRTPKWVDGQSIKVIKDPEGNKEDF